MDETARGVASRSYGYEQGMSRIRSALGATAIAAPLFFLLNMALWGDGWAESAVKTVSWAILFFVGLTVWPRFADPNADLY
jgi:hypothetical protein